MVLFEGRVLITDCSNKDDRDALIASILNHKSSRATVYVMLLDFRDIPTIREKFPRVLPFVLIPNRDIEKTRRLLNFLPHMDHFVNFLGQEIAREFLNRRSDFRMKDISMAYARMSLFDKILKSNGEGVIFNVDISDNCKDDVIAKGTAAKNSVKDSVNKVFSKKYESQGYERYEQERDINHSTSIDDSTKSNVLWRFLVSIFFFICPCINDTRIMLPVTSYPPDLDTRILEVFEQLYKLLSLQWLQKLDEVHQLKEEELLKIQNQKEDLVKKDIIRLMSDKKESSSATSKAYNVLARLNMRTKIKLEKKRIDDEYNRKFDELFNQHYDVVIEEQIKMLILFWKKIRLS